MKDFDALRDRVEATTQKLTSAQADRQEHTESLVAILRQLEEKHAAQAQQLFYYQKRLVPLEQANRQLAALMENLLDLIDGGFGEESLAPLRDAAGMAAAMLRSDLFMPEQESPARSTEGSGAPAEELFEAGMAEPLIEAADESGAVADMHGAEDDAPLAEADLEMEEDALISLDELLDLASEESPEETVAFEDMDRGVSAIAEEDVPETPETADAARAVGIIDDGGFDAEFLGSETDLVEASFEDVSDATLALEVEEDAADGVDDLPDVVKDAMAASAEDDAVDLVPEIPAMADDADAEARAAEDDLETIVALAQQIEEETASEGAPPPAQSDIRALLMRVEKLAKKAEAMRMAQGAAGKPRQVEKPRKRAGAAA